MTSTCDCMFNDLSNSNVMKENPIMDSAFGEVFDMLSNSNIQVFKCFKNIFTHFSRSIGGWISVTLIVGQTGLTLTYFLFQSNQSIKHIYNITKNYLKFMTNKNPLTPPKRRISNKNDNNNYNNNKKEKKLSQAKSGLELKNKRNRSVETNVVTLEKNSADEVKIPFEEKNLKSTEDLITNGNKKIKEKIKIKDEDEEIYDKKFFKEYMATCCC